MYFFFSFYLLVAAGNVTFVIHLSQMFFCVSLTYCLLIVNPSEITYSPLPRKSNALPLLKQKFLVPLPFGELLVKSRSFSKDLIMDAQVLTSTLLFSLG